MIKMLLIWYFQGGTNLEEYQGEEIQVCQSWKKSDSESLFLAEDRSVEAADAAILQGKRNKNQRVQEDP